MASSDWQGCPRSETSLPALFPALTSCTYHAEEVQVRLQEVDGGRVAVAFRAPQVPLPEALPIAPERTSIAPQAAPSAAVPTSSVPHVPASSEEELTPTSGYHICPSMHMCLIQSR